MYPCAHHHTTDEWRRDSQERVYARGCSGRTKFMTAGVRRAAVFFSRERGSAMQKPVGWLPCARACGRTQPAACWEWV
ncbi:hypothetical protein EON67_06945 [archaeon]|nr:MAG: hypothetical protein EON67_06945 [archaeon]